MSTDTLTDADVLAELREDERDWYETDGFLRADNVREWLRRLALARREAREAELTATRAEATRTINEAQARVYALIEERDQLTTKLDKARSELHQQVSVEEAKAVLETLRQAASERDAAQAALAQARRERDESVRSIVQQMRDLARAQRESHGLGTIGDWELLADCIERGEGE